METNGETIEELQPEDEVEQTENEFDRNQEDVQYEEIDTGSIKNNWTGSLKGTPKE